MYKNLKYPFTRNCENTYENNMSTHAFDTLELRFEGFLEDKSSRKVFRRYVGDICHCPEIFEFLEAVERHNNAKTNKNETQFIIDQFLQPSAPMEINISNEIRRKAISEQDFEQAYDAIISQLKDDIFPRFAKSDVVKRHMIRLSRGSLAKILLKPESTIALSFDLNVMNVHSNITFVLVVVN
jgi:hypothetical protein